MGLAVGEASGDPMEERRKREREGEGSEGIPGGAR